MKLYQAKYYGVPVHASHPDSQAPVVKGANWFWHLIYEVVLTADLAFGFDERGFVLMYKCDIEGTLVEA